MEEWHIPRQTARPSLSFVVSMVQYSTVYEHWSLATVYTASHLHVCCLKHTSSLRVPMQQSYGQFNSKMWLYFLASDFAQLWGSFSEPEKHCQEHPMSTAQSC